MDNESFVMAFWHGDGIMQSFNYKAYKPNGNLKAIISEHKDGAMMSRIVSGMGIGTIKGSSSKGGVKALIGAINAIKEGYDVSITPDGPRGPIYSVADGIVALAQKTDAKIVGFCSKPQNFWQFNSWDKYKLPKPFGTIHYYTSEPFSIKGMEMDEAKKLIKSTLEHLGE
jgi:lysophospholipid acyltransferase (LPLAT)-like uncharacterized protein